MFREQKESAVELLHLANVHASVRHRPWFFSACASVILCRHFYFTTLHCNHHVHTRQFLLLLCSHEFLATIQSTVTRQHPLTLKWKNTLRTNPCCFHINSSPYCSLIVQSAVTRKHTTILGRKDILRKANRGISYTSGKKYKCNTRSVVQLAFGRSPSCHQCFWLNS